MESFNNNHPIGVSGSPRLVRVFCDESRQNAARYMLLGGIWAEDACWQEFDSACNDLRARTGLHGHIKWVKASIKWLDAYQEFLGLFFDRMRRGCMWFRCLEVDTHQYPLSCSINKGDAELGFYKFYYQLLLHGLNPANSYHITLAQRTDRVKTRLDTLKTVLNRGARKKYGTRYDLVRALEPRPAEEVNAIQVVDLLIGAIGYELDGWYERPGAREGKKLLCEFIRKRLRWSNLKIFTPPWEERFNVWRFKSTRKQ